MNTRTTTAGAEHFALAMQSALTRSEVVDTYLSHVPDVIEAAAVGFYQLEAMSGQVVEARAHAFLDSQAQDCADFLEAYERYGRGDDPVLEVALAQRAAIDSSRLAATRWDNSGHARRSAPLATSTRWRRRSSCAGCCSGPSTLPGACHTLPSPAPISRRRR